RGKDHGEIPRRDHRHDAERLAHDETQLAEIGRQNLARDLIRRGRGGAIDAGAVARLEHRLADPRAGFRDENLLDLLRALLENLAGLRDDARALGVGKGGPRGLCLLRRRDRGLRVFARPASGWYSVPIRSTAASTPEFRSSTISTSTHEPIRSARSTPLRPSQSATGASTAAARHSMRKAHSWVHAARRPAIEQRVARNRRRAPFRSAFNDVSDS